MVTGSARQVLHDRSARHDDLRCRTSSAGRCGSWRLCWVIFFRSIVTLT
jgi:hypothetical protein